MNTCVLSIDRAFCGCVSCTEREQGLVRSEEESDLEADFFRMCRKQGYFRTEELVCFMSTHELATVFLGGFRQMQAQTSQLAETDTSSLKDSWVRDGLKIADEIISV